MRFSGLRAFLCAMLAAASFGCRSEPAAQPPEAAQNAQEAAAAAVFSSSKFGVEVAIPAGWTTQASDKYVMVLVQPPGNAAADRQISLDVPDLPLHVPGLIPIGLVKNGYIDDLRKKHPRVDVEQQAALAIAEADCRLVHSSWRAEDRMWHETALLIVHRDRVYILRAKADEGGYTDAKAAFDEVAKSLKWRK